MKKTLLLCLVSAGFCMGSSVANAQATPKSKREAQLRRYSAYNQRYQAEVQQQQDMALKQMMEIRAANAASAKAAADAKPRAVVVEKPVPAKSSTTKYKDSNDPMRGFTRLDELHRSKFVYDKKTGNRIPGSSVPKGYEDYYTTVEPRKATSPSRR